MRGWSEVSGVISFADNPRQISLDHHAAYVNVLLKSDPDTALTLGGGGWDWFSIQLDNDTEMMLCLFRVAMSKTVSTYVELTGYTQG